MSQTQHTKTDARKEICALLEQLPDENVEALLRVLRKLGTSRPIRRWSAAIGTVSNEDAELMRRAHDEDCEGINEDAR